MRIISSEVNIHTKIYNIHSYVYLHTNVYNTQRSFLHLLYIQACRPIYSIEDIFTNSFYGLVRFIFIVLNSSVLINLHILSVI